MAAWTDEQIAGAGNWLRDNIGDRGTVMAEAARLGLSENDLLAAARTQAPGTSLGDVRAYMSGGQPATPAAGPAAPALRQYQPNPYLDQMAAGITQQATRNLNEQIMPGIRQQAIASGGFGDARQGVAEGLAIGRTNDALTNSLANLYGTDYNNDQNRALQQYLGEIQNRLGYAGLDTQRYGIDQNNATQRYGLDLNNSTQRYGIDTNAATSRYGTDKGYEVGMANANASAANAAANQQMAAGNLQLGQQRLGLDGVLGLLDRQYAYTQGAQNSANTIQNTPLNYTQQIGQTANTIAGRNGSTTNTAQSPSNPAATVAGLGMLASNWWNSSNSGGGGWGSSTGYDGMNV